MTGKLAALVLFCVAAATAARAQEDHYAAIRTVGIVSALGDGLYMKQDADFLGSTSPDVVLHTGLDIDGYVAGKVREAVGGRFTVVEPAIDPALLKDYSLPPAVLDRLRARFAQAPGALPDALILVHADVIEVRSPPPFITMTYHYSGLSLTRTKGLFGGRSTILSAQYDITVIDTRTGQQIAFGAALLPAMGIFNARPHPLLLCDNAFWPEVPDRPSPGQARQIQADVMAIIAQSLPNALQNAGLSPSGDDDWLTQWNGQPLLCHHF